MNKPCNYGAGSLGNGITVWDRDRHSGSDYLTVAHIDNCGAYVLYAPVSDEGKAFVLRHAQDAAQRFVDSWAALTAGRRATELFDYTMTYAEVQAAGGYGAVMKLDAEASRALYIKSVCRDGRYTFPGLSVPAWKKAGFDSLEAYMDWFHDCAD